MIRHDARYTHSTESLVELILAMDIFSHIHAIVHRVFDTNYIQTMCFYLLDNGEMWPIGIPPRLGTYTKVKFYDPGQVMGRLRHDHGIVCKSCGNIHEKDFFLLEFEEKRYPLSESGWRNILVDDGSMFNSSRSDHFYGKPYCNKCAEQICEAISDLYPSVISEDDLRQMTGIQVLQLHSKTSEKREEIGSLTSMLSTFKQGINTRKKENAARKVQEDTEKSGINSGADG